MQNIRSRPTQYAANPICRIPKKYAKKCICKKYAKKCSLCKSYHQYAKYAPGCMTHDHPGMIISDS